MRVASYVTEEATQSLATLRKLNCGPLGFGNILHCDQLFALALKAKTYFDWEFGEVLQEIVYEIKWEEVKLRVLIYCGEWHRRVWANSEIARCHFRLFHKRFRLLFSAIDQFVMRSWEILKSYAHEKSKQINRYECGFISYLNKWLPPFYENYFRFEIGKVVSCYHPKFYQKLKEPDWH